MVLLYGNMYYLHTLHFLHRNNKVKKQSVSEPKIILKFRRCWLKYFTGEKGASCFTLSPTFP